jgi:hypothetical protein
LKTRILFFLTLLFSIYLIPDSINAATETYDEYAIKTAFLYRSLHYVDWSDKNASNKFIVICTMEPDSFSKTINSLHQRKVNDRAIETRHLASFEEISTCDVLVIPIKKSIHLQQTLKKIKHQNILTVSDQPGSAQSGVILNFPVDNQKVIIEINIDAANRQNIKFSAKLLRIAKIVGYK